MPGNVPLRILLDGIVSEENAENWWRPELFEKNTRHQLPNSLVILERPPEEEKNYNCFVFAFELQDHTPLLGNKAWEYTKNLDVVVEAQIQDKTLERLSTPVSGALVIYRTDSGVISHVGRITDNGKIISKWSWGPLIEHALYDVPASYGDTVEYYTNLGSGTGVILKDFSQKITSQ